MSANAAREAGHRLISQGFSIARRGTIRTAHIAAEWNTTLCGRTLSEPKVVNPQGYIHGYTLCAACDRKAN